MGINIPVVFLPAAIDACAFYRMYLPHMNTPNSDYYYTDFDEKGVPKQMDLYRVANKKIGIVQRQSTKNNLRAIQSMQKIGLKVIYDLDDNMWNLPHANPAKIAFELYQSGFAECAQAANLLTVSTQGLKSATVGAFHIAKEKILIIPNAIDRNLFYPKSIERDDNKVVIGWGGSNTHNADVKDVFALIPDLLHQNSHAIMEVVGAPAKEERIQEVLIVDLIYKEEKVEGSDKVKKVPDCYVCEIVGTKERVNVPFDAVNRIIRVPIAKKKAGTPQFIHKELPPQELIGKITSRQVLVDSDVASHPQYIFKNWVPIKEYPNRFSGWAWDIAIAPLEDNRFNKSKSNIKMLEAASVGIPCLASAIAPYIEFCSLGKPDLMWLLCHNLDEWKKKLTTLVNDPAMRHHLGQKMYEVMKKYYDMEVVKRNWEHAFITALNS